MSRICKVQKRHRVPATLCAVALLCAPDLAAQPEQNQRRQYDRLERRRSELLRLCLEQPAKRIARIAEVLDRADGSRPFQSLARAQALAEGAKVDARYLFRSGLVLFATPEVVDWIGLSDSDQVPRFDKVNLTVWAPRTMAMPGAVAFDLRILDRNRKEVWAGRIDKKTAMADLRAFATLTAAKVKDLPTGHYRAEARTVFVDDEDRSRTDGGKRPAEPVLRAEFDVMPGFVNRYTRLFRAIKQLEGKCELVPWAALTGAARSADRFFRGEPGPDNDCERLMKVTEQILANVAPDLAAANRTKDDQEDKSDDDQEDKPKDKPKDKRQDKPAEHQGPRHPLAGLTGWVDVELPNPGQVQVQVSLRLTTDPGRPVNPNHPAPPLVLFMPGGPAWTASGRRPSSPPSVRAGYLVNQLEVAGFDRAKGFQLAVLESPGRVENTLATLENVLRYLPGLVRYDKRRVILVGDRHGAAGLAALVLRNRGLARGLVLCNGGAEAITLNNLARLGSTKLLLVASEGHPGGQALRRHYDLAVKEKLAGAVQMVQRPHLPWCLALPMAAHRDLEPFIWRALR